MLPCALRVGLTGHLADATCAKKRGGEERKLPSRQRGKIITLKGDKRADGFIKDSDGKSNRPEIAFLFLSSRLYSPSSPSNKPINAYLRVVCAAAST